MTSCQIKEWPEILDKYRFEISPNFSPSPVILNMYSVQWVYMIFFGKINGNLNTVPDSHFAIKSFPFWGIACNISWFLSPSPHMIWAKGSKSKCPCIFILGLGFVVVQCACHGSPFPGSGQCAWQAATNGEDLSDLWGPACLPGLLLWTSVSTQPVSHQDTHSFELLPAHIHDLTSWSWYKWLPL